jgi:hypothetical protein
MLGPGSTARGTRPGGSVQGRGPARGSALGTWGRRSSRGEGVGQTTCDKRFPCLPSGVLGGLDVWALGQHRATRGWAVLWALEHADVAVNNVLTGENFKILNWSPKSPKTKVVEVFPTSFTKGDMGFELWLIRVTHISPPHLEFALLGNTTQGCRVQPSFIILSLPELLWCCSWCSSYVFRHCLSIDPFNLHLRWLATKNTWRTTNPKDMFLLLFEKEI